VPERPVWIDSPAELEALAGRLAEVDAVAVDTEADSLHHYPERLCLLQLADPEGRVYLVDTLAVPDLEPLRPLFAAAPPVKVFHSGDNDLGHLKRRYGLGFTGVSDTLLAARFLGVRELGLERLLDKYLGVQAIKSQQKTDWARRPLTPAQEAYAAMDVQYLHALRERLEADVRALGREAWLLEECEALATLTVAERTADEDAYRRLRGAAELDRRGLAILRELHAQREAWARAERRPPFKVVSPETLVALSARRPRDRAELVGVPGLTPRLVERYGEGLLDAVARGLAGPLPDLTRASAPPRPAVPAAVRRRVEALKAWRASAATETGLDPGVLLPQRLIDTLATAPPADLAGLMAVPGFRAWRANAFGPAILAALPREDAAAAD
jgi:ribonuclease D